MNFNTKLQADYTELINQYLDNIPIENENDFKNIIEALKTLIEPNQAHTVTDSLKGRIQDIQYLLDSPEMYVQDRANDKEFKGIVLARVVNKIKEFEGLSSKDKEGYISHQQQKKSQAIEDKETLINHQSPIPGSEGYILSEHQWLQEQQNNFQLENTTVTSELNIVNSYQQDQNELSEITEQIAQLSHNLSLQISITEGLLAVDRLEMEEQIGQLKTRLESIDQRMREYEDVNEVHLFEINNNIDELLILHTQLQDLSNQFE